MTVIDPLEQMASDAHNEAFTFEHLMGVSRSSQLREQKGHYMVFKSIAVTYHEYVAFHGFTPTELREMQVPPWG